MTSTSCNALARNLLALCLHGRAPDEFPPALVEDSCGRSLFGVWVEGLADRFEPNLCDVYARLFSRAVARAVPGVDAAGLLARYRRVRRPRPVAGEPRVVNVLSRVTLGADVAVTSVLLDAARRRFREAEIRFVGPVKNWQLFAADPRLRHVPVEYRRGSLRDRLAVWDDLRAALGEGIVLDPDSRLTQLGLLPVCDEDRYFLFESRGYGGTSDRGLAELAAAWAEETLGVAGARPYIAPRAGAPSEEPGSEALSPGAPLPHGRGSEAVPSGVPPAPAGVSEAPPPRVPPAPPHDSPPSHTPSSEAPLASRDRHGAVAGIAVSLGVGENPAKRLPDPFEEELLRLLAATGLPLVIDRGAGGEERDRVERAVARSGVAATFCDGSFAEFAAVIASSRLYVGYDSAGQHVAAACGVPLVSIFAGFPSPRMFQRWRPHGLGAIVLRIDRPDPVAALERVRAALSH